MESATDLGPSQVKKVINDRDARALIWSISMRWINDIEWLLYSLCGVCIGDV